MGVSDNGIGCREFIIYKRYPQQCSIHTLLLLPLPSCAISTLEVGHWELQPGREGPDETHDWPVGHLGPPKHAANWPGSATMSASQEALVTA